MKRASVLAALPIAVAAIALTAAGAASGGASAVEASDGAAKSCAGAKSRSRPAVRRGARKARRSYICRKRRARATETLRDLSQTRQPSDLPAPGSPARPTTPTDPGPSFPRYIGVTTREFAVELSRPTLAPGDTIVELVNRGEDPHDLHIARETSDEIVLSFPETRPGHVVSEQVHLGEGTWRLWCSLPGHEAAGMVARLQVTR